VSTPPPRPSLRSRLVWRVVLPLVLTWGVGTGAALWLARQDLQQAYDRALLDDAYAIAAQVVRERGQLHLNLSEAELGALLYDQSERVYFAVQNADGEFLAGHGGLVAEPPEAGTAFRFGAAHLRGRAVRTVTLRRDGAPPFLVVVAQTTEVRQAQLNRLVLVSVALQLSLLALLAVWLRRAIARQLAPLLALQRAVEQRDADDLTALRPELSDAATTRDMQRLGGAINSLLARLSQSLAAQREFTGNVAHELRTPLAGIGAQAEYALAQTDPAVWREQLQGILASQARSSHYVAQLLALARADEAQSALRLRPVALGPLAREVVLRSLRQADRQGVDLGGQGLDTPAEVVGDAVLIEGLLTNLLDNALRYGAGAAEPRITVDLSVSEEAVALCVLDNGAGIAPTERERLQRRGERGEGGGDGGAGLGLAIVRRYAQLMGARFELRDAPEGPGLAAVVRFQRAAG
jgi:two-component system sensor histidine kinase TctE